jgi:4'-phosphopantetheinyl transferase EntD
MVYMFQRPESMLRAVEKAEAELRPGAWLVSLEFEAHDIVPVAVIEGKDSRPVWMYQLPFKRRT